MNIGRAYVEALAAWDFAAAEALEDATLRAQAPAAALGAIWTQLQGQLGAFESIESVRVTDQAPYRLVMVRSRFARAIVDLQVTVDESGRVGGFFVRPATDGSAAPSPAGVTEAPVPAYVRPDAFTETGVTVGREPWLLPGTLTMPAGDGPFPAVVLVAGSGPQDRDETIGPNKPLRDLAWGLASRGIAVLRYDKRTLAHGARLAAQASTLTVNEETVDDAILAVVLLRSTPGVDPGRVFLAGHSLGGHLAPRIAGRAAGVRGLVLLEANSRPLPELILDQVRYLAGLDGTPSPEAQAQVAMIEQQVARALSPALALDTPATDLPLGVPAAYWLDLQGYDALAAAAALDLPMLLIQGGRDYQVTVADLDGWRRALGARADVVFREHPALDHLLFAGQGPSRPDDYQQPGRVAPEVIEDIAGWILAH
ncbi:MAG: alpha/beta fold hydrolase [Chloroflexi bacterium]|nr:alpha/beta fold hydrolase [Chloroflexota bacterium]